MTVNLHTHTWRCRHADGNERNYIQAAIKNGLKTLGFSDHCPYLFPDGYYSTFRMYPEQTGEYFETIASLKQEYTGYIEILSGLETEYYPTHFGALLDLVKPYKPDYMILGQHFLGNEYDDIYSGGYGIGEAELIRYVDQTLEGLGTGVFTYFAHPDLIHYPEDDSIFEKQARRLCEGSKSLGIPLEINLLGLSEGRHYPRESFWKIAAEVGCEVVFGCDAHTPSAVANPYVLKAADDFAAKFGLKPIEYPRIRPIFNK